MVAKATRNNAGLTSEAIPPHTGDEEGTSSSAPTSSERENMARKPEDAPTPSYYKLIEDDRTVPKADGTVGPPEELGEPEPMVDLSKPEDFPDDVQDVIDSASTK
jgi:hypothetical protein